MLGHRVQTAQRVFAQRAQLGRVALQPGREQLQHPARTADVAGHLMPFQRAAARTQHVADGVTQGLGVSACSVLGLPGIKVGHQVTVVLGPGPEALCQGLRRLRLHKAAQRVAVGGLGASTLGDGSHLAGGLCVRRGRFAAPLATPDQAQGHEVLAKVTVLRVRAVAFTIQLVILIDPRTRLVGLRALHHSLQSARAKPFATWLRALGLPLDNPARRGDMFLCRGERAQQVAVAHE